MANQSEEVTLFLDKQDHPLRAEIEHLRNCILNTQDDLMENIKWNSPNYSFKNEDRITMRIQPPKQIQLIFHCGAKVREQPKNKLIENDLGLLVWKENNRAIASFKNMEDIKTHEDNLAKIITNWLHADYFNQK